MTQINFGSLTEEVITPSEFPLTQAREQLNKQTIAVLGYGVQGPAQALNLKDNGFNVIIGQRKNSSSWDKALQDGWIDNTTLFSLTDAAAKADIIYYLLSDAGQIQQWNTIKQHLTPGKTLVFSHGFGITFANKTLITPPNDIDVVLVAPKGSGRSVRKLFLNQQAINSSYAIHQDASGQAKQTVLALGIGIGSGYLFQTTFENEVLSDLTGERGVLMGALAGIIEAQYQVLRQHGHSPSEAFNETVEELTQSLVPLIGENGMDWMFSNCSTTAQRGALDWMPKFKQATLPVFESLYESVKNETEAEIVIEKNSASDYKQQLFAELNAMGDKEIWQVGRVLRELRPNKKTT